MQHLKNPVIHPLLIAAYPVLALLAYNIEEISPRMSLRALATSLIVSVVLLLFCRWLLKDWNKAGLVASITLILFFSYGHVYKLAETMNSSLLLGRHRILTPTFLVIWSLLVWLVVRQKGDLSGANRIFNLVAAVAIFFPLFTLGRFAFETLTTSTPTLEKQASAQFEGPKPDIYYIILDGYSRADALAEMYDFDNTDFIQGLEALGFYVAPCSLSNYAQTLLSLSSSMNMDYLQSLDPDYANPQHNSRAALPGYIHHGAVRQYLENLGYHIIAFDSGLTWTNLLDADVFLKPSGRSVEFMGMLEQVNEFESMLLDTSGALLLTDATVKLPELFQPKIGLKRMHRERIFYALDHLPETTAIPSPKFVFAHIVSPHTPFLIGPDGEMVDKDIDNKDGYRGQVTYINKRITPVLGQIIAQSQTPPVIIVQADHGAVISDPPHRMQILNAYYLPGGGDRLLYDSISPVNSFRLVFNYYFGTSYKLLDDLPYYSSYEAPFDFSLQEDANKDCP